MATRSILSFATLIVGVLWTLLAAAPVLAHAALVSSDPADKAVLAAPPTAITLTFSEGVVGNSSVKLLGPDGSTIAEGGPAKDGDTTMTIDRLLLAAGAYAIEWTSVADDGDIERGKLAFSVTAEAPATDPATAAPAPAPGGSTTPTASGGGDVIIPIIAALMLIGVVGFVVLRRNRAA